MVEPMNRPNVILITVDSLRPDHLGCYGYGKPTSPNLDAFARRCHVFERAWAAGPNTPTSFPALMASRMPFGTPSFGVLGAPLTLAEMLRGAGYRTQGFNAGNPYVSRFFGYDRGFDQLADFLDYEAGEHVAFRHMEPDAQVGARSDTLADRLRRAILAGTERATRPFPGLQHVAGRLRRLWRTVGRAVRLPYSLQAKVRLERAFWSAVGRWVSEDRKEPFFLWVHAMTVHVPYAPPARCQRAASGRAISRARVGQLARLVALANHGDLEGLGQQDVRDSAALYDAEVRHVDELLGRLFTGLRKRGRRRSVVIVTADHGEQFLEHGRLVHPSFHYNELLRVPLLIHLPGQSEGRRIARQVGLVDLMPTLAEVLGIEPGGCGCVGRSFASLLRGSSDAAAAERLYVAESFYGPNDTVDGVNWQRPCEAGRRVSFQNSRIKLAVDLTSGDCSVFDLRADPGEKSDLAARRPELAQIAQRLACLHVRQSERERASRAVGRRPELNSRRGGA